MNVDIRQAVLGFLCWIPLAFVAAALLAAVIPVMAGAQYQGEVSVLTIFGIAMLSLMLALIFPYLVILLYRYEYSNGVLCHGFIVATHKVHGLISCRSARWFFIRVLQVTYQGKKSLRTLSLPYPKREFVERMSKSLGETT